MQFAQREDWTVDSATGAKKNGKKQLIGGIAGTKMSIGSQERSASKSKSPKDAEEPAGGQKSYRLVAGKAPKLLKRIQMRNMEHATGAARASIASSIN